MTDSVLLGNYPVTCWTITCFLVAQAEINISSAVSSSDSTGAKVVCASRSDPLVVVMPIVCPSTNLGATNGPHTAFSWSLPKSVGYPKSPRFVSTMSLANPCADDVRYR